jgi:DNA-binding transcriptional LysR family regulator
MNLDQLEAFKSIVGEGGFRAASQALNKSQPALSVAIKNLEEEFGVELFDRSSYRPKLTQVGATIYQAALRVLETSQTLKRIAHELGNDKIETSLRVSVDPLASLRFIEMIAQECARPSFPVALVLNKAILHGGIEDLISGAADLALGPCAQTHDEVETIDIQEVKLVSFVSRKLLAELHKPTRAFLNSHPQIFVYNRQHDEAPDPFLPIGHHTQSQKIYVYDHFMKLNLIASGLGWGRLGDHEAATLKDLVKIPSSLCPETTLRICLMRSNARPLGPIARRIWDIFSKLT